MIELLRPRDVLLVLDNFEHLVEAATDLAELLAPCPRLKMLITSRAVRQLYGEHEFPLAPLTLPAGAAGSLEQPATMPRRSRRSVAAWIDYRSLLPFYGGSQQWYGRLQREHDNLRRALRWCLETRRIEAGFRLAAALWWFWAPRGHLAEGRGVLRQLLAAASRPTRRRADALHAAGSLAFYQGDLVEARHLHAEELEIRQTLGDQAGALAALESLAMIAVRSGGTALAGALSQFAARIESARKALGQAAAAEAWAIGMSMSLQAAVAYAIERDLTDVGPLTPRELEVAALVAQGLSNRQDCGAFSHQCTYGRQSLAAHPQQT